MAENDTANLDQKWLIRLTVPDADGNDVATDGPIVWTSSDATVIMPRNVSADGKTGELKPIIESRLDVNGNPIGVQVTFTGDVDRGEGITMLSAITIPLFAILPPSGMGTAIVLEMSAPMADNTAPVPADVVAKSI